MPRNQHNLSKMFTCSTEVIIRPRSLPAETGVSISTIRRLELAGNFPKRIKLSAGAVGYLKSEVQDWLDNRQRLGV